MSTLALSTGMLLAVDPSLTATGWAIADIDRGEIVRAGVIRPPSRWARDVRIDSICATLEQAVVGAHDPDVAVIEVPSGRPGRGSRGGATGHLALYGWAVGEIRRTLLHLMPIDTASGRRSHTRIECYTEREWTRSIERSERVATVRMQTPQLDWSVDRGHDMADACGLAYWWLAGLPLRSEYAQAHDDGACGGRSGGGGDDATEPDGRDTARR